jgi:hypothetical protein
MFFPESSYQNQRRKLGAQVAARDMGDIHPLTKLYGPNDKPKSKHTKPSLNAQNLLLDINEHFLELSNPGEYQRALSSMLLILETMSLSMTTIALIWTLMKDLLREGLAELDKSVGLTAA